MLSRVADSIFWMGRYMERTNGMLRVLRTTYISLQDEVVEFNWRSVLQIYGHLQPEYIAQIEKNSQVVLEYVICDRNNEASVINNITKARENARAVQDHITKEMWQCLNDYYHLIREDEIATHIKYNDPITVLDTIIKHGMLLHGTTDITMSRGEAFNYLNLGRYLERAIQSTDILRIKLGDLGYNLHHPVEAPAWRYLLFSLSGYELYLKTYRGNLQADHVLNQILYNIHFPHSVLYCLQQLNRYFERLKADSLPENYSRMEFLIGRLMNNLKYSTWQMNNGEGLRVLLRQTRNELVETASAFSQYYFGNTN